MSGKSFCQVVEKYLETFSVGSRQDRASAEPQTTPFVLAIGKELVVHCVSLGRGRTCGTESECSRDCEIGEAR